MRVPELPTFQAAVERVMQKDRRYWETEPAAPGAEAPPAADVPSETPPDQQAPFKNGVPPPGVDAGDVPDELDDPEDPTATEPEEPEQPEEPEEPEKPKDPECPPGQRWVDTRCKAIPQPPSQCPPAYRWVDGRCKAIPQPPTQCPPGQRAVNGVCEVPPPPQCAPGERVVDGRCEPPEPVRCRPGERLVNGACVGPPPPPRCRPGEKLVNGRCQAPPPRCRPGEKLVNGACVAPPPRCRNGEKLVNGRCVSGGGDGKPPPPGQGRLLDAGPLNVTIRPGTGAGKAKSFQKRYSGLPANGCVVSFAVLFEPGFEWSCRGKVGGISVGPGTSSGCNYSRNGASLRLMWEAKRFAPTPFAYVYIPEGSAGKQPQGLRNPPKCGAALYQDDFKGGFKTGVWYRIQLGIKVNSQGKSDGQLLFGVDDKVRTLNGVMWRQGGEKIDKLTWNVFHGGGCSATKTSNLKIRDVRVRDW